MPSTYTTNLGIEKPATGEQSGTWGDTVNLNYDLFDQAINGVQSVTLAAAGSSGSPRVLAITDGTVSEGRNKFIEFVDGGDLGATAYVQLTPNDAEKIVHIRNSLSGGRSVIVFQGTYNASNDFEIPNGKDVVLKFDGAGSGAVVADVFVDLRVTGLTAGTADINGGTLDGVTIGGASAGAGTFTNLTASGTVDFTGATVSDLGTVTTAAFTAITDLGTVTTADINGGTLDGVTIGGASAAAATVTNLTASGIVDFNGATVSDLGTVTTADINGGTLDGVTIGGASAGAGTFTNLTASGAVDFNGATISNLGTISSVDIDGGTIDGVTIGGSSAGAGSFTTLAASGDVTFDGGTFFVDASGGTVAVGPAGNTSPEASLHVQIAATSGVAQSVNGILVEDTTNPTVAIMSGGTGSPSLAFGNRTDLDAGKILYSNFSDQMRFYVAGSISIILDDADNLRVGAANTNSGVSNALILPNTGTATNSPINAVVLFSEDVSSSAELKVRDEAGNITTLSPHNFSLIPEGPSEDMAWGYYSERDGKKINVDMLKALRILEQLSGEKLVYEEN